MSKILRSQEKEIRQFIANMNDKKLSTLQYKQVIFTHKFIDNLHILIVTDNSRQLCKISSEDHRSMDFIVRGLIFNILE